MLLSPFPCRPYLQATQDVRTVLKKLLLHHSWVKFGSLGRNVYLEEFLLHLCIARRLRRTTLPSP